MNGRRVVPPENASPRSGSAPEITAITRLSQRQYERDGDRRRAYAFRRAARSWGTIHRRFDILVQSSRGGRGLLRQVAARTLHGSEEHPWASRPREGCSTVSATSRAGASSEAGHLLPLCCHALAESCGSWQIAHLVASAVTTAGRDARPRRGRRTPGPVATEWQHLSCIQTERNPLKSIRLISLSGFQWR